MFIGAAITSGIFYFINKSNENEQKESLAEIIESIKKGQASDIQANQTINDSNTTFAIPTALSIVVGGNDNFYYYRDNDCSKIEKINFLSISDLLKNEMKRTKTVDLMVMIKLSQEASYKNSIDLLDAITVAGIPPGHFAEVALSEKEKNCIKNYKKN